LKAHWKYFKYVVRHKWFVFLEAWKLGIVWCGIVHDLSKFRPSEWFPYVHYFYGPKFGGRDETGYYRPTDTGDDAFDFAWLLHQKRNRHHWQWWLLPEDEGGLKVMPMDQTSLLEMLADWYGAGRAQKTTSSIEWYHKHRGHMTLETETRVQVERMLESRGYNG